MADGNDPFLITPPPGLLPPVPEKAVSAEDEAQAPSITLPAIISDSSTVRVNPVREPVTARPPAPTGIPLPTPSPYERPAVASAPVGAPPTGNDELPAEEADNDETRIIAPGLHSAPSWRLTLPDGSSVAVGGALFLGRNPTRAAADAAGDLLALNDETKSVSKTHAMIHIDSSALWVTDLDSTNGVYVAYADGSGEQAEPGEPLEVPPGSDLVLGEFVIQVERS